MVKKCCIIGCRSNYNVRRGEPSTTAFQFPRDETLRELWIDSIGRSDGWTPTVFSYVCVKHFAEVDVKQRNRRQVLVSDAVPRIFPEVTPEALKGVRFVPPADDSILDTTAGGANNTTVDADSEDESDEYEVEYLDDDEDDRDENRDEVRSQRTPRKCCIPGCKTNYQSFLRDNPSVATFPFPKDAALKQNWCDRITEHTKATSFEAPKSSGVCALHFTDSDFVKPAAPTDAKDVEYVSKTAVPSVFPIKEPLPKKDDSMYKKGARRCSVPYCKTNTEKILRTTKTETVYTFPKDLVSQTLWRENLRKAFPRLKVSPRTLVCIKHFEERFLSKQHVVENKRGGSVEVYPRKITSLVKHAFPTIFELPAEEEPPEVDALEDPVKVDIDSDEDDDSPSKKRRSSRKRRKPIKFEKILLKKIKKEPKTDGDEAEPEEEQAVASDDEEYEDDEEEEEVTVVKPRVGGKRRGRPPKKGRPYKTGHAATSWTKTEIMTEEEITRFEKMQAAKIAHEDAIVRFDQLVGNLHKIQKSSQWLVAKDTSFVKFFTVKQTMGPPIIDLSVCISRRLIIKIYRGREELDFIKFSERAGCDGLKYSSVGKLLRFLCDPANAEDNVERTLLELENLDPEIEDFKEYVKGIGRKFKDCVAYLEKQQTHTEPVTNMKIEVTEIPRAIMKLKFLQYQLISVFNKVTRYNEEFMEFCIEFFNAYPEVYNWCRERDHFSLPCDRYLFLKVKQEREKRGEKPKDRTGWNQPGTFRYQGRIVKIFGCRKLTEDEIVKADDVPSALDLLLASKREEAQEYSGPQDGIEEVLEEDVYEEDEEEEEEYVTTEEVYPTSQIRVLASAPIDGSGMTEVPIQINRQNVVQTFQTIQVRPANAQGVQGARTIVLKNSTTASPRELYLAVQNMRGEYIKLEKSTR